MATTALERAPDAAVRRLAPHAPARRRGDRRDHERTVLRARRDNWLTSSHVWLRERRHWLAAVVVMTSVLDLVVTQLILRQAHTIHGVELAEANPVMSGVVMTWWAWPIRVGIPGLIVGRALRRGRYALLAAASGIYGAVVVWNTYLLWLVS